MSEDGHRIGRNTLEYIVFIRLTLVQLCAFVGAVIVCMYSY